MTLLTMSVLFFVRNFWKGYPNSGFVTIGIHPPCLIVFEIPGSFGDFPFPVIQTSNYRFILSFFVLHFCLSCWRNRPLIFFEGWDELIMVGGYYFLVGVGIQERKSTCIWVILMQSIVRCDNCRSYFIIEWKAWLPYTTIYYTQLLANWWIDLDTWIFVKTFKVSLLAIATL